MDRPSIWETLWRWGKALWWTLVGCAVIGAGVWQGIIQRHIQGRSSRLPRFEVDGGWAIVVGVLMIAAGASVIWGAWKTLKGEA